MDGVALITGASRGIGASIAHRFATSGAAVAIAARTAEEGDHRLSGSLATTAEEIRRGGGRVLTVVADLAKQSDRARLVETVERELGPIDVLVNNAAVTYFEPVLDFPERHFEVMFEVQVRASFELAQRVLPGMRERAEGVVVNVSSMGGRLPGSPANWAYSASKHALGSLSDSLAEEVRPFGIRVVCVEPGFFRTDVVRKGGRLPKGSPYRDLEKQVAAWYSAGVATGGDPAVVGAAIVAAVEDPATPLHLPVGADAVSAISGVS